MALSIQDLPYGLLLEILSYVAPHDLLCVRRTCKQFHSLTFSRKVWVNQLQSVCKANGTSTTTTYNLASLTQPTLERIVLHPSRFVQFLKDHRSGPSISPDGTTGTGVAPPLPYKVLPLADPTTGILNAAFERLGAPSQTLVDRSGRFIVTTSARNNPRPGWAIGSLCLWDLGVLPDMDSASEAHGVGPQAEAGRLRLLSKLNVNDGRRYPQLAAGPCKLLHVFTRVVALDAEAGSIAGDCSDMEVVVVLFVGTDPISDSLSWSYQLWSIRVPPLATSGTPPSVHSSTMINASKNSDFCLLKELQLSETAHTVTKGPHTALDTAEGSPSRMAVFCAYFILVWDFRQDQAAWWRYNPSLLDFCAQVYLHELDISIVTLRGQLIRWTLQASDHDSESISSSSATSSVAPPVFHPLESQVSQPDLPRQSFILSIPWTPWTSGSANNSPAPVFFFEPGPGIQYTSSALTPGTLLDAGGHHQQYFALLYQPQRPISRRRRRDPSPLKQYRVYVYSIPISPTSSPDKGNKLLDFSITLPQDVHATVYLRFIANNLVIACVDRQQHEIGYMVVPRFDSIKIPIGHEFRHNGVERSDIDKEVYWRESFARVLPARIGPDGTEDPQSTAEWLRFYHDGSGVYLVSPYFDEDGEFVPEVVSAASGITASSSGLGLGGVQLVATRWGWT